MAAIYHVIRFLIEHIADVFQYIVTLLVLMYETVQQIPVVFSFFPPVIMHLILVALAVVIICHIIKWEN